MVTGYPYVLCAHFVVDNYRVSEGSESAQVAEGVSEITFQGLGGGAGGWRHKVFFLNPSLLSVGA